MASKHDSKPHGKLVSPPSKGRNVVSLQDSSKARPAKDMPAANEAPAESDMVAKRRMARQKAEQRAEARTAAKRQQAAERIASATEELASGVAEANAAAEQLTKAMEQISQGATQASSACQESEAAAAQLTTASETARDAAGVSLKKIGVLQDLIRLTTSDIERLIGSITVAAEKNVESARMIAELERQAEEIGNVVRTVATIADQTNLLALNAAIEAARAGEHGRGFAVVADEVRGLAEVAEKSARQIRDLIGHIRGDVNLVAKDTEKTGVKAKEEVEKGRMITQGLLRIEKDMDVVQQGAKSIDQLALESSNAIGQFRQGTNLISASAEEAATAANEASAAASEQRKGLQEVEVATEELAQMTEELKTSLDSEKSSETLASTAEELSATLQQSNSASQQMSSYDDLDAFRQAYAEGAVEFLMKPLHPNELFIRVERSLQPMAIPGLMPGRTPLPSALIGNPSRSLELADLQLDSTDLTVRLGSHISPPLTSTEFKIIALLSRAPNNQCQRAELNARIWPAVKVSNKALDVHITNLRKKIAALDLRILQLGPNMFSLQRILVPVTEEVDSAVRSS